ncbi:MAG: hypothetical protein AAGG44_15460, partial [Planctomycetota bacterium]
KKTNGRGVLALVAIFTDSSLKGCQRVRVGFQSSKQEATVYSLRPHVGAKFTSRSVMPAH